MPVTQKSSIDQAVRKYLAESRYTLQDRPGIIWRNIRSETLPQSQGPSVNIPKYGTITTYALTEGVDMTQAQEITDTAMVITPAEFGAQVVLTDLMLMTVKDEFFRVAGRLLGDSFDRQREQTLCDDCDNFSVSFGADGTALSLGAVMAAHAMVKSNYAADGTASRGGEPAPEPIHGFFAPAQLHALRKTMAGHTAGAVVQASGGTASMGTPPTLSLTPYSEEFSVAGVNVHASINFNKATDDTVKGGVLSKEAFIGVQLGGGPEAEKERDASLRAWEVNFVGRWARGEYNDLWGREMLYESARVTS